MRWSRYLSVHRPARHPVTPRSSAISLMVRAGMIRKVAAGIYSYLPMGWRSLLKLMTIVRREMDAAGSVELSMPAIQPAELWEESGRWTQYGASCCAWRTATIAPSASGRRTKRSSPTSSGATSRATGSCRQPLPDPDQVPGRDPAPLRPHARARVHHEGRLLLSRAMAQPRRAYQAMHRAYCRIFEAAAALHRGRGRHGAIGGSSRTSSWCSPRPARAPSCAARMATTAPMSRRRRPAWPAGPQRLRRGTSRRSRRRERRPSRRSPTCSGSAEPDRQDAALRDRERPGGGPDARRPELNEVKLANLLDVRNCAGRRGGVRAPPALRSVSPARWACSEVTADRPTKPSVR